MQKQPDYLIHPAPSELKDFVRSFIVANEIEPLVGTTHAKPTGCNYLGWVIDGEAKVEYGEKSIIYLNKDYWHISGQIYQRSDIALSYSGTLKHILVEFTPSGLYQLFGLKGEDTVDELRNAREANENLKLLCSAVVKDAKKIEIEDINSRISLLQKALLDRIPLALSIPDYLQQGINAIVASGGARKIADIIQSLDVSERQFNRKFTEIVGIPPKFYAKTVQMNNVLMAMLTNDDAQLTELAQASGFFDQAHFNHVISEFLSVSPMEFLQSEENLLFTFLGRIRKD